MIPSAANSDYPKFVADQVLTSDNLNDLFGHLDEQGRMTRTNLIGMGIVCGMEVKTSTDGKSITITKGVGVTSHGYLISVPETTYSKRTTQIFDAVKCEYYNRFVNIASKTQKFNLWELKQEAEETDTTALTKSFLQDQDKIVLMFVELLEENNKNCSPDSCDDKGITITINFRPLLVPKAEVDNFLSNSSNTGAGKTVLLPEYKMKRYDVPATLLLDSEDVMQGYLDILSKPFIKGYKDGITNAYDMLETLLSDEISPTTFNALMNERFASFTFLFDGTITQTQAINLQYYYDFFSDLALAYDELRLKVKDAVCACLPNEDLFPRHILLGEAIGFDVEKSLYRTRFMSSPVLSCCAADTKAVKMLFRKIMLLLENFSISSEENNTNKRGLPIRITPSTLGREPLSEKAIPFYYSVNKGDNPLYLSWSPLRAVNHTENQVLSYHAGKYNTQDDHITHPLQYDLEPNNFLRIEGHIGKDYKTVVASLDAIKKANRLPFEVVALSSDTRGIFNVLNSIKKMDTTGSVAGAFAEMIKHGCCFADLFLALDNWITRLKCCLADQRRYYMAQPSFVAKENVTGATHATMRTNVEAMSTEGSAETIGQVYEAKFKAGFINNQFVNEVFVNITTGKTNPGEGLIMMPYKIDRLAEILPQHITELDVAELEKRAADITGTASQMRAMFASPNIAGNMQGVNISELQSRLQMNCIGCLLQELRTLIREFLLRLLAVMVRQKLGFYAYKNPGINHKAGVPMGGTFIVVYHEETERREESIKGGREIIAAMAVAEKRAIAEDAVSKKRTGFIAADTIAERKAAVMAAEKKGATGMLAVAAPANQNEQTLLSSALLLEEIQFLTQVKGIKENPNPVLNPIIDSLKDGTVIADFYLPYLCASDCAPTQMVVISGSDKTNRPPVAKPGDNITITLPANSVVLDGSTSSDPDGTIETYLWEKLSGENAGIKEPNKAKTDVVELVQGKYVFKLTVTDNEGASHSDTVSVDVLKSDNKPPQAKAVARPEAVTLNPNNVAEAELNGKGSTEGDGKITSFLWKRTKGIAAGVEILSADKAIAKAKFTRADNYEFTLTITDENGTTSTDKTTVKVNAVEVPRKTCSPLNDVLTEFKKISSSDRVIMTAFLKAYPDLREINAFYKNLDSKKIPDQTANNQIEFFNDMKIADLLVGWIRTLSPIIQQNAELRSIALQMLNNHAQLAYYISCFQLADIDDADVKMQNSLSILSALLKALLADPGRIVVTRLNTPLFNDEQKEIIKALLSTTRNERLQVKKNNEEGTKPKYVVVLDAILNLF